MAKSEFGGAAAGFEGAYLCVRAYGDQGITYSLRMATTACPASWGAAGEPLMCSSPVGAPEGERRYSQCTSEGRCECSGPYAKPVPQVFPGERGGELEGSFGSASRGGDGVRLLSVEGRVPSCLAVGCCRPGSSGPRECCADLRRTTSRLPAASTSPPGLGFEDCSTPVLNISRAELSANKSFQLEGEAVEPDQ